MKKAIHSPACGEVKDSLYSWGFVIAVTTVAIPLIFSQFPPYYIKLASSIMIMILYGVSFNLLYGYTGYLSFGQAAYFGSGVYVSALILRSTSSLPLALLGGSIAPALLAIVFGYFCVKRSKLYFAMLTLAFAQLIYTLIFKWRSLTGGDDGIVVPRIPYLHNPLTFYFFILALVLVSVFIHWVIVHSPFGHMLKSICQNQERTEFIGVPVEKQVLVAFIIAGFFGGLAGAIYAPFIGVISPKLVHWTMSLTPVIMVVFGGAKHFWGPAIGAIVYIVLKDIITLYTDNWLLVFGLMLLIIVLISPRGVMGVLENIGTYIKKNITKANLMKERIN